MFVFVVNAISVFSNSSIQVNDIGTKYEDSI